MDYIKAFTGKQDSWKPVRLVAGYDDSLFASVRYSDHNLAPFLANSGWGFHPLDVFLPPVISYVEHV